MMIEPILELAVLADAEEIAALYLASWADALPDIPRAHGPEATRLWIEHVMLVQGQTWVARCDNEILGFLTQVGDTVEQLYLKPGHYRQGIGSRLLNQAKALSPDGLQLYTFERNQPAQAFYRAHGFHVVARRDGSGNEEGEPDILYQWTGDAENPIALV